MSSIWPWLAVAGLGALHGPNPATGWMFAAALGLRSRNRAQALRALKPIAAGHFASVALVAGAVAAGLSLDRFVLQILAAVLLAAAAVLHLRGRKGKPTTAPASHAGLALWSFMMANAHGAGLVLVPALIPLCTGDGPAREIAASGSLAPALAAVGVHMAAMLAVTGLIACLACRGVDAGLRWCGRLSCAAAACYRSEMQIRPITDADIPAVARLMRSLSDEFIMHESSREAAASFARENNEEGLRGFIAGGTVYHVAEIDNAIAGFIAIREKKHVYHMFVAKAHHRKGIAGALWQVAREAAGDVDHTAAFTVNASNYAVPVYEAMGFTRTMPMQTKNGVHYNPMQLNGGTIA